MRDGAVVHVMGCWGSAWGCDWLPSLLFSYPVFPPASLAPSQLFQSTLYQQGLVNELYVSGHCRLVMLQPVST